MLSPLLVNQFLDSIDDIYENDKKAAFSTSNPDIVIEKILPKSKQPIAFDIAGILLGLVGFCGLFLYFCRPYQYIPSVEVNSEANNEKIQYKPKKSKHSKKLEWYIVYGGAFAMFCYAGVKTDFFRFLANYTDVTLPEEIIYAERTQIGTDLIAVLGMKLFCCFVLYNFV